MSLKLPNDKIVYNLPEQVGKNTENIAYLAEVYKEIDSIPAEWNDVKADITETMDGYALTMGGYATTMGGYANTMGDYATTMAGYKNTMDGYALTMGGYASQVDTWANNINAAAISAINGATITPANVNATGNITGASIIENMSGYTFAKGSETTNITREFVYSGVVKNGNKITFVIAVNLTRTDDVTSDVTVGNFSVPTAVFNKLYPTLIGGYYYLDNKIIQAWRSDSGYVDLTSYILKGVSVQFRINVGAINNLPLNTKHYYRYEVTFLLSENLAS